ncbi:hypothetical protein RUM44_007857 [Polyplax serrata]|uniref:Uncharacterized protein n=1 Tax=Polyplax serrata TaxID=468196 RepID=A0ABR1B8Q1_POLSC
MVSPRGRAFFLNSKEKKDVENARKKGVKEVAHKNNERGVIYNFYLEEDKASRDVAGDAAEQSRAARVAY